MGIFGGGNEWAKRDARDARKAEKKRQRQIELGTRRINDRFEQFDGDFYRGRRGAYSNFAMPQLDEQYRDAGEDLAFSLADRGLTDSSVRAGKESELEKLYGTAKQKVTSDAIGYENDARTAVEDARAGLLATLYASGDATGSGQSALARSKALTRPPSFNPLSQVFYDFTSALGTQAGYERSAAYGGPGPRYNTGLFGGNSGSVVNR